MYVVWNAITLGHVTPILQVTKKELVEFDKQKQAISTKTVNICQFVATVAKILVSSKVYRVINQFSSIEACRRTILDAYRARDLP